MKTYTTRDRIHDLAEQEGRRRGSLDNDCGMRPRTGVVLTRATMRSIVRAEQRARRGHRESSLYRALHDEGWALEARRVRYRRVIQRAFDAGYSAARLPRLPAHAPAGWGIPDLRAL